MDDVNVSKRQLKRNRREEELYERLSKQTVNPGSRPTSAARKRNTVASWWIQIVCALAVVGLVLFLKSGEDSYNELISHAKDAMMDPYRILGVHRKADKSQIKQAYRDLSLKWHPDRRSDCDADCHAMFKTINDAYKILSDSERKRVYDETSKIQTTSKKTFANDMHTFEYEFSEHTWKTVVQASLHGYQLSMDESITGVWAVLIVDPASAIAEHILPMWSDIAARMYGSVSFLRVDSTHPRQEKLLPMRIRITPAIILLSPGNMPVIYENIREFRPNTFVKWLQENMPSHIDRDLIDLTQIFKTAHTPDTGKIKTVIASRLPPSAPLKAGTLRHWSTLQVYYTNSNRLLQFSGAPSEAFDAFEKGGILIYKNTTGNGKLIYEPIPRGIFTIDIMKLRHAPTESLDDVHETQAGKATRFVNSIFANVVRANSPAAYEESYKWLCDENHLCLLSYNQTVPSDSSAVSMDLRKSIQHIRFPITRRGASKSTLLQPLKTAKSQTLLLDIPGMRYKADAQNWKTLPIRASIFPQLRPRTWERLARWSHDHPIILASLLGGISMIYMLYKVFKHYRKAKKD